VKEEWLVRLDDGTKVRSGAMPVETATFDEYLEISDDLAKIVQSCRKVPEARDAVERRAVRRARPT